MVTIIDSRITLAEALVGSAAPREILSDLVLLDVEYISFDDLVHQGQLIVHRELADDVKKIFAELCRLRFPIQKVIPIVAYDWSDERSMADNNTSAFNYRIVYGTNEISNHARGRAIDMNPAINPYVAIDGTVFPNGAVYDTAQKGTIVEDGEIVSLFTSYGWEWGGHWPDRKDWQHFQKI